MPTVTPESYIIQPGPFSKKDNSLTLNDAGFLVSGGTLMFLGFCVPFSYIGNFCKSRQTGYQMKA